jgi:hypothetical protein
MERQDERSAVRNMDRSYDTSFPTIVCTGLIQVPSYPYTALCNSELRTVCYKPFKILLLTTQNCVDLVWFGIHIDRVSLHILLKIQDHPIANIFRHGFTG